jgi:hypothetical protein
VLEKGRPHGTRHQYFSYRFCRSGCGGGSRRLDHVQQSFLTACLKADVLRSAECPLVSEKSSGLATAFVLDTGGQTDHKLSPRLESVDFEVAAKLADS